MTCKPDRVYPLWTALALALLLSAGPVRDLRAERPPAPRLLPETTVAMLSVVDATELRERFMNTAMGRMSQDPQLKPLVDHLYMSLTQAVAEARERIGLSLPELLAIPQGECTLALVAPQEATLAIVLLFDVGDQLSNGRRLLERAAAALEQSGGSKSEETVEGTKLAVYDRVGPPGRKLAFFEKDATIVVGSDPAVLKQLLVVWNGGQGKTLADNSNFATIMQRCRAAEGGRPQLVGYIDPVGIMRGMGQGNPAVQMALAMLPVLGFDGLLGAGASMTFDVGNCDSILHAHLLLDSPRTGVLKMIAMRSGDMTPEPWVPADVVGYTTLHWDVDTTYKTLATVYDSIRGEGALGQLLQQRILGPTGIDFETEILKGLDGRVTIVSWIERPITLQSQASLVGLKLSDASLVEKALEKLAAKNEGTLAMQTQAGQKYYQVKMPRVEALPPERRPALPCFGVLDGYLLVANRVGLYQQVVATSASRSKSLDGELDFKLIVGKIGRLAGGEKPVMIGFQRPEESMRFLYDLANSESTRTRLSDRAKNNRFFGALDAALKSNPLPPFSVFQRYLAPGGSYMIDDQTGVHYTTFSMRRK